MLCICSTLNSILLVVFLSCKYKVGHAGKSEAGATNKPTNLEFGNLRASMSKAYKDMKDDVDDVKALLQLNKQFSQTVSLRLSNQIGLF